jgi:hypothetical protein
MAIIDDVESGMNDLHPRCQPDTVKDSDDDDPICVSEYGISDDGLPFMHGHSGSEFASPSPYTSAPGRSSILRRPLLGNF